MAFGFTSIKCVTLSARDELDKRLGEFVKLATRTEFPQTTP